MRKIIMSQTNILLHSNLRTEFRTLEIIVIVQRTTF